MIDLKVKTEYWPIERLLPYVRNPRKNDHAVERGASFIKEFGFSVPVLVKSDGTIIDGHLRLKCAKKLDMDEVPVIVRDDLTDIQVKAFRLSVNKFAELADWDDEMLKLELMELSDMEYNIELLDFNLVDPINDIDFGDPSSRTEGDDSHSEEESSYTQKIKAPIYEIKGDKPEVSELYDGTKTNQLMKQIVESDIPEDVKNFLKLAAQRHTVFSYEKIAEYYAHAPAEIQDLMEKSALVIIDFNKAIENGFVSMAKELAEAYTGDAGDEDGE